MSHPILTLAVALRVHSLCRQASLDTRPRDDRGEGVISTAIAILVMAFLGTMMWFGFKATFTNAQVKTDTQVEQIGR